MCVDLERKLHDKQITDISIRNKKKCKCNCSKQIYTINHSLSWKLFRFFCSLMKREKFICLSSSSHKLWTVFIIDWAHPLLLCSAKDKRDCFGEISVSFDISSPHPPLGSLQGSLELLHKNSSPNQISQTWSGIRIQ